MVAAERAVETREATAAAERALAAGVDEQPGSPSTPMKPSTQRMLAEAAMEGSEESLSSLDVHKIVSGGWVQVLSALALNSDPAMQLPSLELVLALVSTKDEESLEQLLEDGVVHSVLKVLQQAFKDTEREIQIGCIKIFHKILEGRPRHADMLVDTPGLVDQLMLTIALVQTEAWASKLVFELLLCSSTSRQLELCKQQVPELVTGSLQREEEPSDWLHTWSIPKLGELLEHTEAGVAVHALEAAILFVGEDGMKALPVACKLKLTESTLSCMQHDALIPGVLQLAVAVVTSVALPKTLTTEKEFQQLEVLWTCLVDLVLGIGDGVKECMSRLVGELVEALLGLDDAWQLLEHCHGERIPLHQELSLKLVALLSALPSRNQGPCLC